MQNRYLDYLREEGYKEVSIDANGHISFKFGDCDYFAIIAENDFPKHFFIFCGYRCEFASEEKKMQALQVANCINTRDRIGKVVVDIDEEIVRMSAGIFFLKPEDFKLFLRQCLSLIKDLMFDFKTGIEKESYKEYKKIMTIKRRAGL